MRRPWLIAGSALLVVVLAVAVSRRSTPKAPAPVPAAATAPRLEAVSALGTLLPAGDVRRLAAPTSAMGGSPRLLSLAVEEGQRVKQGQLLATCWS